MSGIVRNKYDLTKVRIPILRSAILELRKFLVRAEHIYTIVVGVVGKM